jgi:DNA-binding XRE family transcriptional regulator
MRAARVHAGLNQQDAAAQIGIKQGTLSELEKTATKSAHTAKAALVYKVNAAWLQDGTGSMLETPHTFSARAAFVAARLDEITDPAAFDQACVMCEAFAALGKAGQLPNVAQQLALAGPALSPRKTPPRARTTQSAADPSKQA